MIIKQLKILFDIRERIKILIIFLANIFSTILELIGIGSIPIFALIIVDLDKFILKMVKINVKNHIILVLCFLKRHGLYVTNIHVL